MALLAAALAGCQTPPSNLNFVCLTRQSDDLTGPKQIYWRAARTVYLTDARGKTQLLAESAPAPADRAVGPAGKAGATQPAGGGRAGSGGFGSAGGAASVVEQTLYVRLIWSIDPTLTGTDPSAINAHIGYLVRDNTTHPDRAAFYYEGTGNVYVDQPRSMGGQMRFVVRHALLRLTRSNRDRIVDPLGTIELTGEIAAGADPQATEQFRRIAAIIDALPPAGSPPP
jgi:hypothetical protein